MRNENDILQSEGLKKSPFMVPEGYFNSLTDKVTANARTVERESTPAFRRLTPYMALAASFLILVSIGGWILRKASPSMQEEGIQEWLLSEYVLPQTEPFVIYDTEDFLEDEQEELSQEDIISYLIYEGVYVENYQQNE